MTRRTSSTPVEIKSYSRRGPRSSGGGESKKTVSVQSVWRFFCPPLTAGTDAFLQPSDEEVLGYDEPSDEDEGEDDFDEDAASYADGSAGDGQGSDEEPERLGNFGREKADYYNADAAETEADALEEEKEARRIQQKQLESMTEADFGFDESQWLDEEEGETKRRTVTEVLPEQKISDDIPPEERIKILNARYPEFTPLAKDLLKLQSAHESFKLQVEAVEVLQKHNPELRDQKTTTTPVVVTKYRALTAYLGALSMYFALLTSSTSKSSQPMAPSVLREHPVIKTLVSCRQLWEAAQLIPTPDLAHTTLDIPRGQAAHAVARVSENGNSNMALAKSISSNAEVSTKEKRSGKRKSRAERAARAAAESEEAARRARVAAAEASLAELDNLVTKRPRLAKIQNNRDDGSDLGDEGPLTAEEAAAKAQRKKSLRFYTSQIAQKANKRGNASRDAGGDTDLPYKERTRDRIERLNREAEKRGNTGADLGGSDDEDQQPTNREREANDSDDEYYQTITSRAAAKKEQKSAISAAHAAAAAQNGHVTNLTETIGSDGKRGISYEIAKNKGLTPHRKKDVRNPRLKKKKQYEKKLKRLGSSGQRQVYKGGEGRGGYGGESTGINRSVIRSVKL